VIPSSILIFEASDVGLFESRWLTEGMIRKIFLAVDFQLGHDDHSIAKRKLRKIRSFKNRTLVNH